MKAHSSICRIRSRFFQIIWIITFCIPSCLAQSVPSINSFSPIAAAKGEIVTISGSQFSNVAINNVVYFGAAKANVLTATETTLQVAVPAGATFCLITVTVNGYTAYSNDPFRLIFPNGVTLTASAFSSRTDFVTGAKPIGVSIGDFDEDTKSDIAVVNSMNNNTSVLKNTTAPGGPINSISFAERINYPSGSLSGQITVADLDSDGKLDLIIANKDSNTISILRNISTTGILNSSSFSAKVDLITGDGPKHTAVHDLNNDGKPDICVTNYDDNTFSVFKNISETGAALTANSFAAKADFPTGERPSAIAIANLDADNKPDIILVNMEDNSFSIFENTSNEDIAFDEAEDFDTGDNPVALSIGDLDGDDKPEIVIANKNSNTISVFGKNSNSIGSNPFDDKIDFNTDSSPHSILLHDLDGDANLDIVVSCAGRGTINLFRNTGSTHKFSASSLGAKIVLQAGSSPAGLAIGDLNGDGKAEIIVTNQNSNTVSVFQNMIAPTPFITALLPERGAVGSTITVTGFNFSTIPSGNTVRFNGTLATVLTSNATTLTVIVPSGATTGLVTVTVNGRTGNSPSNFFVCAESPISIIPPAPTICSGSTVTLTAAGANTYVWNPSIGLSSATGSSVQASPITTTTYTVSAISENGCPNIATVTVTVKNRPVITVSQSQEVCEGTSAVLEANGGTSYTWTPALGLSGTTGNSVIATPSGTTTYSVSGAALNGCTNTASVTVTVKNKPLITVSPSREICAGTSAALGASGANTYLWSPAAGLSATTGNAVDASPVGTTTYTVTGTASNGCTNFRTVTVTVKNKPIITVSASKEICQGSSTALGASGANAYTWSPAAGLSATTGNTIVASPSATTIYTVTGTGVNGCTSTSSVTVLIMHKPELTVSPAQETCGRAATLTASGANTYSWSPSTGLSETSGATVEANPSSTTTYTVTGTGTNGCTNSRTVIVNVNNKPLVTVSPSTEICEGSVTTLAANGASVYQWSPSTGISATQGNSVIANPDITTTYTVLGTGAGGCTNTASVTVTVKNRPTINITPSLNLCAGLSATLTATGASSYNWTPSTGLSASTGSTVIATPENTTTYNVTGTSIDNCASTATVVVTLTSVLKPAITISPASTETYTLTSSSESGNQWYKDGIAIPAAMNQTFLVTSSGSYAVQVKQGNCISQMSDPAVVLITTIDDEFDNTRVRLSPNPAKDILYINWIDFEKNELINIVIIDMIGKNAVTRQMFSDETTLNISLLHQGHFIFQARQNNKVFIQRFIKN